MKSHKNKNSGFFTPFLEVTSIHCKMGSSNDKGSGMHPLVQFKPSQAVRPYLKLIAKGSEGNMTKRKQYVETEYSKLLRDPKWQRKRLEILQRDDFGCQACESKEKTLHVHHSFYKKGAMPWEYPDNSLVTLCEDCHLVETEALSLEKEALMNALAEQGLLSRHYYLLTKVFSSLGFMPGSVKDMIIYSIAWHMSTKERLDNAVSLAHGFETFKEVLKDGQN